MTDPRHMAVAPKHVIPLLLLQTSGSIWGDPVYMSLLIALKVECEDDWWMTWKGSDLIARTIPAFSWTDWGKYWNPSRYPGRELISGPRCLCCSCTTRGRDCVSECRPQIVHTPDDIRTWRTRKKKLVPLLLCLPQIPHGLTRVQTLSSAVRSRRLTAWTMARP